jgi:hypothetical protein
MNEVFASIESLLTRGYGSIFVFFPAGVIAISFTYLLLGESFVAVEIFKITEKSFAQNTTSADWPAITLVIFFTLGSSMILNSLHKIAFDSLLRRNFCTLASFININFATTLDKTLASLRILAISKLTIDKAMLKIDADNLRQYDYYLYECIGGIVFTDTREYVNDARINGYISLSFQIILLIELLLRLHCGALTLLDFFLLVLMVCFGYIAGYEVIKSIYKLRAIRLYTNYLMGTGMATTSSDEENTAI